MEGTARKAKQTSYTVFAKVNVDTEIEIVADNLEEALAKARKMTLTDFVDVLNGVPNDHSIEITGILG